MHKLNEQDQAPRGIVVVDVGYTNTKAILFSSDLKIIASRKIASAHRDGDDYKIIDAEPTMEFLKTALRELDAIMPVDVIVPCAHGACLALLTETGELAFPIMDYASQPPPIVIAEYLKLQPPFSEVYCTLLPMALTHALQIFWQQNLNAEKFKTVKTILPWIQYIALRLSGVAATEISSMACQSQLLNVNTNAASNLAIIHGWAKSFAPMHKAWKNLGALRAEFAGDKFNGRAAVLAGVHDSNANYLRYLAGGLGNFTLLSTGTWVISFNSAADITKLDHTKDTNTNTDVLGNTVACSRFFGGKELEVLSEGASADLADLKLVQKLLETATMALPSFTDSGGPFPGSGNKGRITGLPPANMAERASLAALYCALMVSAQLDAVSSENQVIVDGPFSKHYVFLAILAQLRPSQKIHTSDLNDGTAAGAACLALFQNGKPPVIEIELNAVAPAHLQHLQTYCKKWQASIKQG